MEKERYKLFGAKGRASMRTKQAGSANERLPRFPLCSCKAFRENFAPPAEHSRPLPSLARSKRTACFILAEGLRQKAAEQFFGDTPWYSLQELQAQNHRSFTVLEHFDDLQF